jgi:hypothetical protein
METETDPDFYSTHSPIDFINFMDGYAERKSHILSIVIPTAPHNWVRKEHLPHLLNLVRNRKKIQRVISSARGSNVPNEAEHSSIGTEAQNLIECYRTRRPYPDFDFSSGQPNEINAEKLEMWWKEFGQQ